MSLLDQIEKEYEYGEPIFIAELSYGKYSYNSVKAMLSKYVKKGYLKRYCSGIYFRYKKDIFGDTCIDIDKMIEKKYIKNNDSDIFGYYSGITLLNNCGLTTQVPYKREIVTNKETNTKRIVTKGNNKIILRKSPVEITKENYRYLQFANALKYLPIYEIKKYNNELKNMFNTWKLDKNIMDLIINNQTRKIKDNYRRYLENNELA